MATVITVFGISNCDTIKKARGWLDRNRVEYEFHDYRKQGLERELLGRMEAALGWEAMLNRRGTTWRGLPDAVKQNIDRDSALSAMLEQPALIKRPILESSRGFDLGFSEDLYQEIFG